MYYLDLSATEMEADCIAVIVKTTTVGAKTTVLVLYTDPETRTRKAQDGASGTITLDASASGTDDFYNDQALRIVGGTGAGQVRLISDYVGSTKVVSVTPNWSVAPDDTSVFQILPRGRVDLAAWLGSAPNALVSGRVDSRPGAMAAGIVDATAAPNLDATVSSRLATAGYTAPPSAASVRSEIDANSTKLDVAVSTRLADADYNAPPTVAEIRQEMDSNSVDLNAIIVALAALTVPTANQNADALLDRASAIDGYTVREILRVAAAALAGKSSGGASDDTVRAIDDSKARITATVDANGHRTAVVVDAE